MLHDPTQFFVLSMLEHILIQTVYTHTHTYKMHNISNSPVTGEFPTQMDSNAENVSIWWRHHEFDIT